MAKNLDFNYRLLYFTCGIAALGGFLFGFDMAVVSGVLPFIEKQFNLSAAQEGWFVSSALIGCIGGVIGSGMGSDRLGRKKLLIFSALLFLISAFGCTFLSSFPLVIVARVLSGIGVGIASNIVPLYISEIAPARIRGRLVTYYQLAVTLGILIAYCSNALILHYTMGQVQVPATGNPDTHYNWFSFLFSGQVWRVMFGVSILPSVLFLLGLFFIPESPRWLLQNGKAEDGLIKLKQLIGEQEAIIDAQGIKGNLQEEKGSYRDLLAPGIRRALILGILLPLFSQFCGINAIIYYGPTIFSNAGISLTSSFQSQVIFGLANMLFTFIAVWKVDDMGRRPLYLIGTAIAAVSLFLTGLCFYLGSTSTMLLPVLVLVFLGSFAFSIGPLKFVVASEIFPAAIRGKAIALSIMVMWVADTIVGLLMPISLRVIGTANTFWFFAAFCLVAFVTVYRLLPETKRKSLEQIEQFWKEKKKK